MKKTAITLIIGSLLLVGFASKKDDKLGAGEVVCNPEGITQIRFERRTAKGIIYRDAFNYTLAQCQAYNNLSLGQKMKRQKDRADAWVAMINQEGDIGSISSEQGDE